MKSQDSNFLRVVEEKERLLTAQSSQALSRELLFFRINQDAFWALLTSHNNIPLAGKEEELKKVTLKLSLKMMSISHVAMRLVIGGFILESLALFRVLNEIVRTSYYLKEKPNEINDYVSGELWATSLLKREQSLLGSQNKGPNELWVFLSQFTHSTVGLIDALTSEDEGKFSAGILNSDIEATKVVCRGIVSSFLLQYCNFRLVFHDVNEIPEAADKQLFKSELSQAIFDSEFLEILSHVYEEISKAETL